MSLRTVLRTGIALLVLNTLLTLVNPGPTPWPQASPRLSPELCLAVLAASLWVARRGGLPAWAMRLLAALTALAVLVRCVEITSFALFGRSLNLYWDGQHLGEMLVMSGAPGWLVAAAALAMAAGIALVFFAVRGCWRLVAVELQRPVARRVLATLCVALLAAYGLHGAGGLDTHRVFSQPVAQVMLRQVRLVVGQLRVDGAGSQLAPSPAFRSNLAALRGGDVLLLFAESYGVSTLDEPQQASQLAAPRAAFAEALAARGARAVSARVRSPTFAGGSWLAHGALLTGVDTHNPLEYDVLLTTRRPTLARHFAAHGYRSVGWMPGLQRPWPEGKFFGFDRIADADGIGYAGLPFGPWRIPDQAAMALLQSQELHDDGAARAPRFIVFPTVTSHAPFRPVAPYVPDWRRLTGPAPYSAEQRAHALDEPVSWRDPLPAYVQSIAYTFQWLGAWLRDRAPAGLTTIVVGDHQPFAGVSGAAASWDVPVHLISSDDALLRRFEAAGFVAGLAPPAPAIGGMHELTAILLNTFDAP